MLSIFPMNIVSSEIIYSFKSVDSKPLLSQKINLKPAHLNPRENQGFSLLADRIFCYIFFFGKTINLCMVSGLAFFRWFWN